MRPALPSTLLADSQFSALHEELGHERHVHQDHPGARRLVLGAPVREPVLPAPAQALDLGRNARRRVPVGAFPAADVLEAGAARGQAVVQRRAPGVARAGHRARRVVAAVDHAERLDGARAPVLGVGLVAVQPVDVDAGDVGLRVAGQDPVRQQPADAAAGQDADRIEPGRDEVVGELRRRADDRQQVRREALRAAEELPDARRLRRRHARQRGLKERRHPLPVGLDLTEREVPWHALDLPGRRLGLEQADHQPAAFLAVVAAGGRVLEHRRLARDARQRAGDQVVVLGGLQRDVDAVALPQLARPHAGAVDHRLALHGAVRGLDAGHRAVARAHAGDRHAFDDPGALQPRAPGQRHRHVDRIGAAVFPHVEAGQDVVHPRQREELADLARAEFVHVDAHQPVEGGHAAVLLEPVGIGRHFDEAAGPEAGLLPGLGRQPRVEIARVLAHLGRRLRGRAEGDDQPRRVPGGARGQPVALEQQHLAAHVRQVIGDRAADDAAADDDDAGGSGQVGAGHRRGDESLPLRPADRVSRSSPCPARAAGRRACARGGSPAARRRRRARRFRRRRGGSAAARRGCRRSPRR